MQRRLPPKPFTTRALPQERHRLRVELHLAVRGPSPRLFKARLASPLLHASRRRRYIRRIGRTNHIISRPRAHRDYPIRLAVIPPEPSALLPQAAASALIPAPRITLYARPFLECGGLPPLLQGEARLAVARPLHGADGGQRSATETSKWLR